MDHSRPIFTFNEWRTWVFDHPVTNPAWYWDDREWPVDRFGDPLGDPAVTLSYLIRLFEAPETLPELYDLGKINQGLWFIAGSSSEHKDVLTDAALPLADRQLCVSAMEKLYARLFAPACEPVCRHTHATGNPLNDICYMWWDLMRFDPKRETRHDEERIRHNKIMLEVMLETMSQILRIDHIACREGALHGLGHLHENEPQRVRGIIADFLHLNRTLEPVLHNYAKCAYHGYVQ